MKTKATRLIIVTIGFIVAITSSFTAIAATDAPHNASNNINCGSCHGETIMESPFWGTGTYDQLCLSCHRRSTGGPYSQTDAPAVTTHSDSSGSALAECRDCHNPHYQRQKVYKNTDASNLYLATGKILSCEYSGKDPLTNKDISTFHYSDNPPITYKSATGWDATKLPEKTEDYRGAILFPNVNKLGYNYPITAVNPTAKTITVNGNLTTECNLFSSATFAAMYGQYIKDVLNTKTVKFFDQTGTNSFADGDTTYNGVCEVCHTLTTYHKNDGSGTSHYPANNCSTCHSHTDGFAHGGGTGAGCGDSTSCHGTQQSHPTHVGGTGMQLSLTCADCHNTSSFPQFKDGQNLANTTACNTCHSPSGTYDGVNDATIGAKANWAIGVYTGSALQAGKEKWCATCHDESPSVIQEVPAPNVVGNESASYIYGTGWGYYKTGHGLPASETYPSKGGVLTLAGRPVHCDSCHDYSTAHIDGNARTFNDGGSSTLDPSSYRQGYRLKLVAVGQGTGTSTREPMLIPWPQNTANSANNYRLCVSCHDSGPFINADDTNTNLKTDGVNRHEYHLVMNTYKFSSDWDFANDNSRIICVNCHNVHGSTRLAMVRDGKLIGREPGLKIWYNNDDIVTYNTSNPDPPSPENLPLSASTGTIWIGNSSSNLCSHCHGSPNTLPEYRTPFQNVAQTPMLSWTGETGYESDGAYPDSATSGSAFTFRVKYTDTNNDAPSPIELWIDMNDNGFYEAGEKYAMTGADTGDLIYTDGKIYSKTLTVNSAGDNVICYRFYASDGTNTATGSPTNDSSIILFNNAPTLSWTGETYYENDGVNPNIGGNGANFEFRINYTDTDNQAPASIQVWVDDNDNGSYETGEKHDMTPVDGGDTTYSDGKMYTLTLPLAYAGDGSLNYRFFASDGSANATGSPTANSTVTVNASANIPPSLDWVTEGCRTDGVKPVMGLASGDFEFRINYTDMNNQCPTSGSSNIQVWIDVNDTGDGNYEAGEKFNLTEEDAGDTDCTDGKLYKTTRQLGYVGDGDLNYRFYASDGVDSAVGSPTTNRVVTVVSTADAKGVRVSGGGDPWYSDIQTALDNTPQNKMVLVYPGTYGNIALTNSGSGNQIDHGKTVKSVCGPDVTTISGGTQAVYAGNVNNVTVDGFQITGAGAGIYVNNSSISINNSKIHDNNGGIGGNGAALYSTNVASSVTIANSEIYSNTATNGGGLFFNGGNNPVITNTIIRNNTVSASGAAVFLQNSVVATFNDVTIKDNTATSYSGGVHINGASADFFRCAITGNVSSSLGGFMYMTSGLSTADFENCIIANNHGTQGGVVYANNVGALNLINTTIADNQATSGNGGAFYNNSTAITVINSILWDNRATGDGYISFFFNDGSLTISDSIIASGGDGIYTNAPYFEGNVTPVISGYTSEHDPMFVDASAGNYHIQIISDAVDNANASYAPANDIDGNIRPQGAADDIGADEFASADNTPVLSWTGEANYIADGVNPDSGANGSDFAFRINYTDADNDAPVVIQLWIDENDDGAYSGSEKYAMIQTDPGDTTYSDGNLYEKTVTLTMAGDGNINYHFYATDGTNEATGAPASNKSVTVIPPLPAAPTIGTATALSTTSIRWNFTDNAAYEEGFKVHDASHTVKTSSVGQNLSYADETGLTANTQYTRHVHAYNQAGDSDGSASASRYTWPVNPNVTANKTTSTWYNTTDVVFTNAAGFGSSGVQYYRYAWDQNASHTFNDTEPQWTSGTLTKTATANGSWYLHVKSYNAEDVANGTQNYGPYYYDGTAPSASNLSPANGATDVTVTSNLTLTLSDSNSGVNWSTFQIMLSGNKGYSKTYLSDSARITKTGTPASYNVTIDPDTDFGNNEIITATVNVSDTAGNALTPPTWSFTTTAGTVYLDVPVPYATIQAAINAAANGNIVRVVDGTYSENINFIGKAITVKSVNGAVSTKIQGSGANSPVVTFSSGETASAVLEGFTIDNQAAVNTLTRGIYINNNSSPTIKNSIIEGNSVQNCTIPCGGGGTYIDSSSPTFDNCTIRNNSITNRNGGGFYITNSASGVTFTGTTVSNNTSNNHAGGIYSESPLSFTNCNINNNATGSTASYDGGGIYLNGASASATISGGTINGNSGRYGGGIYVNGSTAATPLSISTATISSNTGYLGGGIYLASVTNTVTITGTTISGNTGQASGGGIYNNTVTLEITVSHIDSNTVSNNSQKGGGLFLTGAKTTTITNTTVNSNTTTGLGGGIYVTGGATLQFTGGSINSNATSSTGDGGGVAVDSTSTLSISKTNIRGNKARYGGGIYYTSSSATAATITNCTITGNTHNGTLDGGGFYINGSMDIINSTIAGNYASRYGGGIRVQGGTVNVKNSILWGNTAGTSGPQISGTPTVTYSDIEGGYSGTGNINSDPLFTSFTADDKASYDTPKTTGDFHIQSGSPCKDTGNNADAPAGTDIDGDTRIINGTVDMGSDEYVP